MTHDLDELMKDPEFRREYEKELLIGSFTDWMHDYLDEASVTRKELAERLGRSAGRVSQILAGSENLTLGSIADLGWALGIRFRLTGEPMNREGTGAGDEVVPEWTTDAIEVESERVT